MSPQELFDRSLPALPPEAEVEFFPGALREGPAQALFTRLRREVAWQQDHITMFGKTTPLPRETAWYGDPGRTYTYSGIAMTPLAWIEPVLEARAIVERLAATTFNSVLCNLYRNSNDKLAWHSDDEPELGPTPTIASINFGATRRFRLRPKNPKGEALPWISLHNGDVLIMRGRTQQLFEHEVMSGSAKKGDDLGERINLTFRSVQG